MTGNMRFVSAVSFEQEAREAAADLASQIAASGESQVDFALVFLSAHYAKAAEDVTDHLCKAMNPSVLIGCTGEGVIAPQREIEGEPAIALVAARMPGVEFSPFALLPEDLRAIMRDPVALFNSVNATTDTRLFVLLADPFSTPMDQLLGAFNAAFSEVPMVGGMASGAKSPGTNALIMNERVYRHGAVGVALAGSVQVDVIVSQGCRPIGPIFNVTKATNNVIRSLDGEPPLECINALLDELSDNDRELLRNGLFVGRAIDPDKEALGRGDFLIRGVTGVDQDKGSIAIGDHIDTNDTVQFHVRDAVTAKEDLEMMLTPHSLFGNPSGAFLFSCNGRGTRLYDHPNGDVSVINGFFNDLNLAGFFCAGEIGPIGGKNFLHGQTASLALIRPRGER